MSMFGAPGSSRYYEDMFLKPAVTAAVGTAVAKFSIFSQNSKVKIFGTDFPLWAITGIALYGAGVLGEVMHSVVLPQIDRKEKFSHSMAAGLIQPGVVGAANSGLWLLATSNGASEKGLGSLFAIGAASEVAADYIYNHFITPLL